MCSEPVVEAIEAVRAAAELPGHLVMLSPQGRRLDQRRVAELVEIPRLILLCGRYEGFDERHHRDIRARVAFGGRLCPFGRRGRRHGLDRCSRAASTPACSAMNEVPSTSRSDLMEDSNIPNTPRPRVLTAAARSRKSLLSGDHASIARWRLENRASKDPLYAVLGSPAISQACQCETRPLAPGNRARAWSNEIIDPVPNATNRAAAAKLSARKKAKFRCRPKLMDVVEKPP